MTAGREVNSQSQEWCTPPKYIQAVREVFGGEIQLDPCSNKYSIVDAKVEYRRPENDGLIDSWNHSTIFVNPPYGSDRTAGTTIKHWLRRCYLARKEHGASVQALVPVASNTRHWKDYVWGAADAVAFLYDTRLKFLVDGKGEGKGAPMSCAMIYWGDDVDLFMDTYKPFGATVDLRPLQGQVFGMANEKGQMALTGSSNGR
jgi:DNA N-6-adenine-methyltransferase (Dam)